MVFCGSDGSGRSHLYIVGVGGFDGGCEAVWWVGNGIEVMRIRRKHGIH